MIEALGPEAGQRQLDEFGAYMGATTSDAAPPSNVRMAAHQMALANQQRARAQPGQIGHNSQEFFAPRVPENPPYPYGHARYTSTHRPILKRLAESTRHCFSPSILQEPGTIPIVLEDSIGWPEPVGLC
jgi:hypothetical protein